MKKYGAEFFGTFWLVLGGCGSAVLAAAFPNVGIHRDYQRLGAVHFQWQTDQIEITSPGGFPEGVRLDNLLVTAPRPRNPLLADAFKRAGIVERTARGIDTIFYEQLRNGRPAPSYARSNDATVSVVIPGGAANLDFVRLLVTEAQQGRDLALDELLILNSLWQTRSLTTDEAAHLVQKPETDTRAALHRLVEAGLVEERGQKKGCTWHLSAATYRLLGDKAGYVRSRGFEPLQQGADGAAVRGQALTHHTPGSCGVVPDRPLLSHAPARPLGQGWASDPPR